MYGFLGFGAPVGTSSTGMSSSKQQANMRQKRLDPDPFPRTRDDQRAISSHTHTPRHVLERNGSPCAQETNLACKSKACKSDLC